MFANLRGPLRKEKRLHRTIEITVPPSRTRELVEKLAQLDGVVSLSAVRGASVKRAHRARPQPRGRRGPEARRARKRARSGVGLDGRTCKPRRPRARTAGGQGRRRGALGRGGHQASPPEPHYGELPASDGPWRCDSRERLRGAPTDRAGALLRSGGDRRPGFRAACQHVGGLGFTAPGPGGQSVGIGGFGLPGADPLGGAPLRSAAPDGGGDGRRLWQG